MVLEKELYKNAAENPIYWSDYENIIWAEDLFDIQIVPYPKTLKVIPGYETFMNRLEPYGLVVVEHKSFSIRIIDTIADVTTNRLYIAKNVFTKFWDDIKLSIISYMKGMHITKDPEQCVDRSLLYSGKIKMPKETEWKGKKQSLLDNPEYLFYTDMDSKIFHDKDCQYITSIDGKRMQAFKTRPEGMEYCPACAYRLYIRFACHPISKQIPIIERILKENDIKLGKLIHYIEVLGMKFYAESYSSLTVKCNEDTWIIKIDPNREMSLWHNNYIRVGNSDRYITDGFHEQHIQSDNLKYLMNYIGEYNWQEYHLKQVKLSKKREKKKSFENTELATEGTQTESRKSVLHMIWNTIRNLLRLLKQQ